jgi:hypothetical protein
MELQVSDAVRCAYATAVAIVACPQNGTSVRGLKYRTSRLPSPWGTTNAVSEKPTAAAVSDISGTSRPVASSTTPAGLPPVGSLLKAVYLNISIE